MLGAGTVLLMSVDATTRKLSGKEDARRTRPPRVFDFGSPRLLPLHDRMVVRLQLVLGSFVPAGGYRPAGSSPATVPSYPSRMPSANPIVTRGSSGSLLGEASWAGSLQGAASSRQLPIAAAGFPAGGSVSPDARTDAGPALDEEASGAAGVASPGVASPAAVAPSAATCRSADDVHGVSVTAASGTGGVVRAEVSASMEAEASSSAASDHDAPANSAETPPQPTTPRPSPRAYQPASGDGRPNSDQKKKAEPPRRPTALLKVKVKLRSGPMWTVVKEHTTRAIRWPSVRHWEELLILEPDTLEDVIQLQVGEMIVAWAETRGYHSYGR
jgi:hypothetical protein